MDTLSDISPRRSGDPTGTRRTTSIRTIADTAIGSIVGLVVLAAMFTAIWIARDSSAGAGTVPARAPVATDAQTQALQSPRTPRTPLTYTPISPAQLRELQEKENH